MLPVRTVFGANLHARHSGVEHERDEIERAGRLVVALVACDVVKTAQHVCSLRRYDPDQVQRSKAPRSPSQPGPTGLPCYFLPTPVKRAVSSQKRYPELPSGEQTCRQAAKNVPRTWEMCGAAHVGPRRGLVSLNDRKAPQCPRVDAPLTCRREDRGGRPSPS